MKAHSHPQTQEMTEKTEQAYGARLASLLEGLDGLRIEVDPRKRIGHLILDRPPLNIVSWPGRRQIRTILEVMDDDPDVGTVVVRGANGVFSSGGDVKAFPDIPKNRMSDLHWNIGAPERMGKPVICAMEKYAFGVGFELALACDFRFATRDTLVGLPEITLGQMPGSGGSVRIARIAGMTRARDMVMLGKRIPAELARDWGLLTEITDDRAGLEQLIDDYAGKLNAMAPIALAALKKVLNSAYDAPLRTALEVEGHSYEKLRWTEDYREGIDAFSERRKPVFKGR